MRALKTFSLLLVTIVTRCVEYESGTALHIAASNLSLGCARVLLKFGADSDARDELGRKPEECVPDAEVAVIAIR